MNEPQYNPKLTGIQNFKIAFEKGKLEQKKEELTLLEDLLVKYNSRWLRIRIKEEMKQLQKEIGGNEKC